MVALFAPNRILILTSTPCTTEWAGHRMYYDNAIIARPLYHHGLDASVPIVQVGMGRQGTLGEHEGKNLRFSKDFKNFHRRVIQEEHAVHHLNISHCSKTLFKEGSPRLISFVVFFRDPDSNIESWSSPVSTWKTIILGSPVRNDEEVKLSS